MFTKKKKKSINSGVDTGFLERGFNVKKRGFVCLISHNLLKIPHENEIILLQRGGGGGGGGGGGSSESIPFLSVKRFTGICSLVFQGTVVVDVKMME